MPTIRKIVFLLVLIIYCNIAINASIQKLALIIAIGNYPIESGWQKINSLNDVGIIKSTLLKQGFQIQNITILTDKKATKTLIVSALNNLIRLAQVGDIIYIHYSGHGQQIQDDNNDEVDGYDESLIPFDACKTYKKGEYTGQNHFRDDELGALLNQLRVKIGIKGDIVVILDACHSGTATRGIESCRGTEVKFEEPGYIPPQLQGNKTNFAEEQTSERGINTSLAPMVIISGSGKLELNYEYYDKTGTTFGSLSFAISKIFSTTLPGTSYRTLFEQIKSEMHLIAPRQTPQIEGDIDRLILGGKAISQKDYFKIEKWVNNHEVIIDAGSLIGIKEKSMVQFYPENTFMPSQGKQIASGTIQSVGILNSKVILTNSFTQGEVINTWAFIKFQNTNKSKVRANILRNLQSSDFSVRVNMEMIPITVKHSINGYIEDKRFPLNTKLKNDTIQFIDGDCFKMKIINKSARTVYYQIIDIQPDDIINILIPANTHTSQEYYVKPNESIELKTIFSLGKPFGSEVYKLVATEAPLNLLFMNHNNGVNRASLNNPLEILLADINSDERSISQTIDLKSVSIATIVFKIIPK